ncbi:MAG: hypothetical protein M3Q45_01560, partial [Chloroflexota bacterium]|nr:hypothetical protein [Chloroflexota bacterium]
MATLDYLDFTIEIDLAHEHGYPLEVNSPAGEALAIMQWPTSAAQPPQSLSMLRARQRDFTVGSGTAPPANPIKLAEQWGRTLFDALFRDEVRNRYDVSRLIARNQNKGLRIILRIRPPELAVLPWEFLLDGRTNEHLCLSTTTSLVRYVEIPQPITSLAVTPPLRILGMIAATNDLAALDTAQEQRRVETALTALRQQGLVELIWLKGQTWRALQQAMQQGPWHI